MPLQGQRTLTENNQEYTPIELWEETEESLNKIFLLILFQRQYYKSANCDVICLLLLKR